MKLRRAKVFERFKAGIVDMFMLMMPIQYFMTYIIAGSAAEYRSSQGLIAIAAGVFLLAVLAFLTFSDQTPGYRYFQLHLRMSDGRRANALAVIIRLIVWLATFALLIGPVFALFRRDRAFLHDLLSDTVVIKELTDINIGAKNKQQANGKTSRIDAGAKTSVKNRI